MVGWAARLVMFSTEDEHLGSAIFGTLPNNIIIRSIHTKKFRNYLQSDLIMAFLLELVT